MRPWRWLCAGLLTAWVTASGGCAAARPPRSVIHLAPELQCISSKPLQVLGQPTGFQECANGLVHRAAKEDCPSLLPRKEPVQVTLAQALRRQVPEFPEDRVEVIVDECARDADCTAQPHGYCGTPIFDFATMCEYGCVKDSDCGEGQLCMCDDPVGYCVLAECTVDDDCPVNSTCAQYWPTPGCPPNGFACQSPRDECVVHSQCPESTDESIAVSFSVLCAFENGRRACSKGWCMH